MKGSVRIRRCGIRLLGLLALATVALPVPALAQTAEERARELELQARLEAQLREVHEKQLHAAEEALARIREEMARAEAEGRFTAQERAVRLLEMEEGLRRAQHEAQLQLREREGLLAQAMEERAREVALRSEEMQELQLQRARELGLRSQEMREFQAQRERELQERLQEVRVRVLERDSATRARLEERVREAQEVVLRLQPRVRLGVELTSDQGAEVDRQGVRIAGVMEESPAEKAGLQEGDIITHLDGVALTLPLPNEEDLEFDEEISFPVQRLRALVEEMDEGQEVEVRYLRDGEAASATLVTEDLDSRVIRVLPGGLEGRGLIFRSDPENTFHWQYVLPDEGELRFRVPNLRGLEELENLKLNIPDIEVRELDLPDYRALALTREGSRPFAFEVLGGGILFGIRTAPLNPGLAEYFSTTDGILILEVDEDSELGLQAGDVVKAVDGRAVEDQGDLVRILSSYEEDETVTITLVRKGQEMQVRGTVR